jgi:hypothetical protein
MKSIGYIVCFFMLMYNTLGLKAQGVYFDSLYHTSPETAVVAQIMANDTGYTTIGIYGPSSNPSLELIHLDFDGNMLSNEIWNWGFPTTMIYWYGKSFIKLSDGNFLFSDRFDAATQSIIKFTPELDTIFTHSFVGTDEHYKRNYLFFERDEVYTGICRLSTETDTEYFADLEILKLSPNGEILSQDTIEIFEQQYQLSLSGIFPLSDGGFIVSGARLFDWDPFIVKFNSNDSLVDVFTWGGPLDDWIPWVESVGNDKFIISSLYNEEDIDLYFHIMRPNLMLFDAVAMDSVWTSLASDSLGNPFNFSISSTYDGGFVVCGSHDANNYEYAYIQKWDSTGNELWFKSYRHDENPDDGVFDYQMFRDITEAPDSGLIAVGYYYNGNSDPQHAWVIKLDACGDPVFDSCVVVIDGVWDESLLAQPKQQIFVWPNPFQAQLSIQLPEHSAQVEVFDVLGNLVFSKKVYQLVSTIDLSELPSGIYVLQSKLSSGVVLSKKILKE